MAVFYNQATLSYNNTTVSSNIVSGEIIGVLSAAKTAVSDAYSPGEILTYVVSLVNGGSTALNGLTITDDLGTYTFEGEELVPLTYVDGSARLFINGVLSTAPVETQPAPAPLTGVQFLNITVPAEGNVVLVYQAAANEFASPEAGSSITNTATVSGTGVTDVTASAEVPAENEAILSISKSLTPAQVAENEQITYTFIIQNTGNTAEDQAVITDTFDPVLSDIKVTVNGETAPASAYSYNETTGLFTTTAGAFSVPAASFTRDSTTEAFLTVPGTTVVTVTGTI